MAFDIVAIGTGGAATQISNPSGLSLAVANDGSGGTFRMIGAAAVSGFNAKTFFGATFKSLFFQAFFNRTFASAQAALDEFFANYSISVYPMVGVVANSIRSLPAVGTIFLVGGYPVLDFVSEAGASAQTSLWRIEINHRISATK
jgi:hypothetical protein